MNLTQYLTTENLSFVKRPIFPSVPMQAASTVTITDTPISDDFLGFGVAITGSSCYNLSLMDATERHDLLRSIYGKEGIGLSVARLTIGPSDYSAELYSYDDVPNDFAMEYFSIERDRAYIIPIIREILEINPDLYLFASPWSPPYWMKTGGSMCGGYMRDEYVECYAEYIVRFLEAYEDYGIHISALTPQNEPDTSQHGRMPACVWHPDIEAHYISVLREKLDDRGLDTEIWMYDHNFDDAERVKWMLDTHRDLEYDCDGIAFHYYLGAIEDTDALREAYPKLKLHFTEAGPRLYNNYDTDYCKWGIMISKALTHGYGSFTGWNLMLDEYGGPNIGPFFCGGLITRNSVSGALSYSGQYQAFRHVAPFFKDGAEVFPVEIAKNESGMYDFPKLKEPLTAVAWRNPDGTLVYLLVNPDAEKRQVQLALNGGMYYVELLPKSVSTVVVEED